MRDESSPLRIARIPYINSEAFYRFLPTGRYSLMPMFPRDVGQLARLSMVDGGLMSLLDLDDLSGRFEPLGDLGIAAARESGSVLLFSQVPVTELAGSTVGLTTQSVTSRVLLKLLLERSLRLRNISYTDTDFDDEVTAYLSIGNEALALKATVGFPHVSDLGELWNDWTGTPFVFARFAVRAGLPQEAKDALYGDISASIGRFYESLDETARDLGEHFSLKAGAVKSYISLLTYRLGEEETKGQRTFLERIAHIDRV